VDQNVLDCLADLDEVTGLLKGAFVAKDDLIELMIVSAVAQEHLLIVGPPGTAKSELVKRFALLCSPEMRGSHNGVIPYFEYLLTRFTEPNEIFGPVDIKTFQEGKGHHRVTAGMLPRAEIAFLDEVFKANSAILNALLTVLNERIFYNGSQPEKVPLVCAFGATNEVPDDPTLAALYDRFLIRVWTDNVEEARFGELFQRGWKLEQDRIRAGYHWKVEHDRGRAGYQMQLTNVTTTDVIRTLYRALDDIRLEPIAQDYREIVRRIRAEGIELSDRRVIKLLKLIAASALRRKNQEANPGDFWVLKHVWNDPDQIPHLQTLVEPYLDAYEGDRWSAERDLDTIAGDIAVLEGRHDQLKTDADYADFLQKTNRLRRELLKHSDEEGRAPLLERLETLINAAMQLLEQSQ
jgi:MoxR-like ATPase